MRSPRRSRWALITVGVAALCLLGQGIAVGFVGADDTPAAGAGAFEMHRGVALTRGERLPTAGAKVVGAEPAAKAGAALAAPGKGAADSRLTPRTTGWNTFMTETFEGIWPNGLWSTFDNNGSTGGEVFWDDENWIAHSGSWSGWPAGGGANGLDPNSYYYANDMDSWATYGPFDLSGYTYAELDFWYWNRSESGFDPFYWAASPDDGTYYGDYVWGDSGGWQHVEFDLSAYAGDPSVWIAFIFQSDSTNTWDGPFVDDVALGAGVPNDDFGLATVIGGVPYTRTQDVAQATTALDDPDLDLCFGSGWDQRYKSVWYAYTAPNSYVATVDTIGSDYDTILAVWTGSPGSFSPVACNDDYIGLQSGVQFNLAPGTTYYIEVTSFIDAPATSQLTLNMTTTPAIVEESFRSEGSYDGWVLEEDEASGKGGTFDSTATTGRLGDDSLDRQYRSILDFDTSSLPDGAVVVGVTLRIKRQAISGTNPFTTHGYLTVDQKTGFYHENSALEKFDFHAVGSRGNVGRFIKTPALGWYRAPLRAPSYALVNLAGHTQFRLRFAVDDNDDFGDDYLAFFTGNAPVEADRPELIVSYYVP